MRRSQAKLSHAEHARISGSSLGTKAFHLGEFLAVLNEDANDTSGTGDMDPAMWGVDPYDASELTEEEEDTSADRANTERNTKAMGFVIDYSSPCSVLTRVLDSDGKLIRDIQRKIRKKVSHANENKSEPTPINQREFFH